MQKVAIERRFPTLVDPLIAAFLCTLIYFVSSFGVHALAPFHAVVTIDLSLKWLPEYAFFSLMRSLIAYGISLAFTLVVGYSAAHYKSAERIILPFLDIMQSIPVLGFLPGLVLGLVALFPNNNVGLELAAIISIFTGQVWNMAFSFYSSLKSIPTDMNEAASIIGLTKMEKLRIVELPYSATGLVWNSIMSMAGGWFFLTVCEAFSLGDRHYQLPGLGAYMQEAIDRGNTQAMIAGIIAMATIIIGLDVIIWKPVMAWVHEFRLEESEGEKPSEPLIDFFIRESFIVTWIKRRLRARRLRRLMTIGLPKLTEAATHTRWLRPLAFAFERAQMLGGYSRKFTFTALRWLAPIAIVAILGYGLFELLLILKKVDLASWTKIFVYSFWTLARVITALAISTLWAVPFGIWVSQSSRRLRVAQPFIQLMASFPAPMLYPLALGVFIWLGINFEYGSMALMLLGVQWYVLFNVVAGGMRIPVELRLASNLMGVSTFSRWRYLFLPSVFPSLVTGWITAAGGAWNASIVAEIMKYKGQTLEAKGLGALISESADSGNFPVFAASLFVMVAIVIMLNRAVWSKLYRSAQTRFRLDL